MLLLIPFVEHADVSGHPDLQHYFTAGWEVKECTPRITEGEGLKLFLVLQRDGLADRSPLPASPRPALRSASPSEE